MIKRIFNKKYVKILSLVLLIILALVAIYYVDLNKFNSNLVDYDKKYLMKITYLIADRDKLEDGISIDDTIAYHEEDIIYNASQVIPLTKDGDILYVDLSKFTNSKMISHITDVSYAKNNYYGEVIEGCSYDKETKILRVPFSYYENLDKDNPIPIQAELESLLTRKEIKNLKTNFSVKKLITYNDTAKNELFQLDTRIPLSKYTNGNIASDNLNIYVNNSNKKLDKKSYTYDSSTGTLTIQIPAILINKVDIKLGNNIIKNVFADGYWASELDGYKLKSRPDALIAKGTYNAYYTVGLTHSEGVNNSELIYCYGQSNSHDACKDFSFGASADDSYSGLSYSKTYLWDDSNEWYYDFWDSYGEYQVFPSASHIIPYIVETSYAGIGEDGVRYLDFADDEPVKYILMECTHTSASSTPYPTDPVKVGIHIVGDGYHPDENYLVLRVYTYAKGEDYNGWGGQYGSSYFKVYWEDEAKCNLQVQKRVSSFSDSGNATATFGLYSNSGCTTQIGTRNITVSLNNGSQSAYFNDLDVDTDYWVKETAFVDSNSNNLLTNKYRINSNCVKVTTTDANENGACDSTAVITNTQQKYCYSIKKVDAESNNTSIDGTTWTLTGADNQNYPGTAGSNGVITFSNLKYQTYTLKETSANPANLFGDSNPDYWNDNQSNYTVGLNKLKLDGQCTSSPELKTDTKVYYCLKVKKVDYNTGNALTGAEFTATKGNITINKNSSNYSSSNGITSFFIGDSTKAGNYTITETKAPDGYSLEAGSKTVAAIPLMKYSSESAARTACFSDNAVSSDGTTTIAAKTYNSNSGNNDYIFKEKKLLVNFYKTTEDGTTLANGAGFKVQNSSATYITVTGPELTTDANGFQKACYIYTGTSRNGTVMTTGEKGSTNINMDGEICVAGLPADTYIAEEREALPYHTFGAIWKVYNLTASNTFSSKTDSNTIINYPTEFEFTKYVSSGDVEVDGVDWNSITSGELDNLSFNIMDSNNTTLSFIETSSGVYEYVSNSYDAPSGSATTSLKLGSNRKFKVYHLPVGTYSVKEVKECSTTACNNCSGYYYPDYSQESSYKFEITDCSSSSATSCGATGLPATKSLTNTPTEITFTKNDLYGYLNAEDVVKFENTEEINAFDQIVFKLKDAAGNYLTLQKVGNTGSCNVDGSYAEYRYVPGDQSAGSSGTELHTCGGRIKITHLCRERSYIIEEISVPSDSVFIITNPHPEVTYTIPENAPAIGSTSVTQTISDMPTRVKLTKVDSEAQTTPIDDNNVKFKIYQCASSVTTCTSSNGSLVYFTSREQLQNDTIDSGKEVYKYKGLTSGSGLVSELSPYHGELILRYLPSGYKYTAVETGIPTGYYQVTGDGTQFTVSNSSINNEQLVINEHTKIEFEKQDIYSYYKKNDRSKMNDNTIIFDTIKFILRDKNGNQVNLTKVSDGVYKLNSSGNNVSQLTTKDGSLLITHLNRGEKYYIEEVSADSAGNFTLPTNVTRPSGIPSGWNWAGHPYVEYTIEDTKPETVQTQIMQNTPTRVVFVKKDTATGEIIDDQNITFKVYSCPKTQSAACTSSNGTLVNFLARATIQGDQEDNNKEVYKYSKLNASGVTELKLYNGELILRYLPSADNKYVLVETSVADGYYKPTNEIEFTVNDTEINETAINGILTNVGNVPTEIYFTKNDLYGYLDSTSVVKFEDEAERSAFDQITFKVKDSSNNYLSFTQVGTCTSSSQYSEYVYSPTTQTSGGTELHTCNGKMKITYLNNNSTYKLEEVAVPDNTVFVLPEPHPEVTYNIPLTEPETAPKATISDEPTKIIIYKKNIKNNEDIHEAASGKKQTAQFEVYRCTNTSQPCTKATSTGTPVKFASLATVNGEKVYRFASNQSNATNTVTTLNLTTVDNKGQIVLRYLPANYKYVVVEKNAPDGYYNIEGTLADLEVISSSSVATNTYSFNNYPTMIKFKKDDIYKYYSSSDIAKAGENNKIFDSMTFKLRDKDGNIVSLKQVSAGEYRFIQKDGTTSGNNVTELHTNNGELLITNLYRNEKYYLEETKSDTMGNFILPTNLTYNNLPFNNNGHPVVEYSIPNKLPASSTIETAPESLTELIENKPTRVVFEKRSKKTNELIDDNTTIFEVYACASSVTTCNKSSGTKVYFEERTTIDNFTNDITSVTAPVLAYKYKKLNASSGVSELHTDRGVLVLAYLPSTYKYVLVEKVAPEGYYNVTGSDAETPFTVESETIGVNQDYEQLTERVLNTPTEIIFIKSDLYNYYTDSDVVSENSNEKLLDTAKFVLRDENGNILSLRKTGTNNEEGNVYRYLQVNSSNNIEYINTYKGKFKVTNLLRSSVYYVEEVKSTDEENFILPDYLTYENLPFDNQGHPVVKYILTDNAPINQNSITQEIKNIPTRVRFEKRDSKYNYLIQNEATTFKVYQCDKNTECHPSNYSTDEERLAAGIRLINFSPRALITGDGEDDGVEVYKYSKLNTNGVTELHPDNGVLVLRYLPSDSNYTYVLFETSAPVNYLLPTGREAETPFDVVSTTTSVEEVNVPNAPTALIIRKYADIEGDGEADSDKLLGGAKFKVYKVNNYNANISIKEQEKELLKLKTIKAGIYENRPVLDTEVITTCIGDECSYSLDSLVYNESPWDNIEGLTETNNNNITTALKEGTALVQYLEYDTYYIIEEVEAPVGYSLPENDDNRFTLVHIKQNETKVLDTRDALVNKPTSFTFYKFDEYNTPLDGATFYLQKLDNDKKYNTLTVSKETLANGNIIYRADPNSELMDITTNEGKATVYYLEPGQYRILEVAASEGYELPKKTVNVATFFVDEDGLVYGNNIITNRKPGETIEYLANSKAELIINIQTGKKVIKYGLIIAVLIGAIVGLMIFLKKRK